MHLHSLVGSSCTCLRSLGSARVGRRGLLFGLGSLAQMPRLVRAASVNYQAMILGCIDPRLQTPVRDYAVKQGLDGKYSQFIFAGAAIGAVAPKFADWHKTFWDNLAITIQLHNIQSVIAIDHRDCGADRQQGIVSGGRSVVRDDNRLRGPRKRDRVRGYFEKLYRPWQSGRLQPRASGIPSALRRLWPHDDAGFRHTMTVAPRAPRRCRSSARRVTHPGQLLGDLPEPPAVSITSAVPRNSGGLDAGACCLQKATRTVERATLCVGRRRGV